MMVDKERHPEAVSALLAEAADLVERGATLNFGMGRARAVCVALGVPEADAWHVQEDAARRVIRVRVGRPPIGTDLPANAVRILCDLDRASARRKAAMLRRAAQATGDGRPRTTTAQRMVCPECGEPARARPPTTWLPPWVAEQTYSHLDGEPLCPVIGPGGYQPAAPVPADR